MKERDRQEEQNEIEQNPNYKEILDSLEKHETYRARCLNMIASENAMSPATRQILSSDLGNRYSVGPYKRWFPGMEDYTKIENKAISLTQELLPGADYVTVQPVSGMSANQVAYRALIDRGDLVFVVKEKYGGHYSHRKGVYIDRDDKKWVGSRAQSLLDEYGADVDYLDFDEHEYNIDIEASVRKIIDKKPKLIIVGASEMLFPAPLKELRAAADRTGVDTKILYDAAHVFGLILGGEFQSPLIEGADIVATSTNKTMGGPDHGLVAWTENAEQKYGLKGLIADSLVPFYTSNHHSHHVAGVAVTLAELKAFGGEYARQVVKNARALATALDKYGVRVIGSREKGFTESHEVLIDIGKDSEQAKLDLATANIITSKCPVPYDSGTGDTGEPNKGIRLGTNEMTRMGMNENEMDQIGRFVADILTGRRTPEAVQSEVVNFRLIYQKQRYCFKI